TPSLRAPSSHVPQEAGMNPTITILAAAALVLPLVACDKQQEAEYPDGSGAGYQGGYGATGGAGAGTATGTSTGAGAGGATGGTANPTPQASPLPPGAAVLSSPVLKGTAQSETAGMSEDGGAFG